MISNLPIDILTVIASYSIQDEFNDLLNTNKQYFQHIKKRLIVLNLSSTKSEEYLTNISFRERVLSVVENGWKQVNVYLSEERWNESTLPSDIPIHVLFLRPVRSPAGYIIFCSEMRPELRAANPTASFGELGKMLGQIWSEMDMRAKTAYYRKPFKMIVISKN